MNTEIQKNVPELRFPEFSGEWEDSEIGKVLKIASGKDYKHLGHGGIPVYGTGGLMTHVDNYLYDGDSIGIGRKGTINKPYMMQGKFWTVDTLFYTHSFGKNHIYFIYPLFQKINWNKYNEASGVPSLSKKTLEKIKVSIPKPHEQQKIADFLTAVDEKITALREKKEALTTYKKGVMQQLFSGVLRFKQDDGAPYQDWEEKKLGSVCEITTGKLDANAMVDGGKYRFYTCAKDYFHINEYAFNTEALLVSGNGANVGYIHYYKGQFNAYQRTYVLDKFSENIFYIQHFLNKFLHERIQKEKNEGNTPYIVLSTLKDMLIKTPVIDEQQKIANFLSGIDEKIEAVDAALSQAQAFKKGLLQKMFV